MSLATRAAPALLALGTLLGLAGWTPDHSAYAQVRTHEAGVLVCKAENDWAAVIASAERFRCTFSGASGEDRGEYLGVIRKFAGATSPIGNTALLWMVTGPAAFVGEDYAPGSLAGTYVRSDRTADTSPSRVLAGGESGAFRLRPLSVQVQTGRSLAAGIVELHLEYVGPIAA